MTGCVPRCRERIRSLPCEAGLLSTSINDVEESKSRCGKAAGSAARPGQGESVATATEGSHQSRWSVQMGGVCVHRAVLGEEETP